MNNTRNTLKSQKQRQEVYSWSCNCAGPDWELPDTVTITGPAADSLKNTSVGFASGQPSLSSSNTAVDPEADLGVRGGSGYSCDNLQLYIPQGAVRTTARSAFWYKEEGYRVAFLSLLKSMVFKWEKNKTPEGVTRILRKWWREAIVNCSDNVISP